MTRQEYRGDYLVLVLTNEHHPALLVGQIILRQRFIPIRGQRPLAFKPQELSMHFPKGNQISLLSTAGDGPRTL